MGRTALPEALHPSGENLGALFGALARELKTEARMPPVSSILKLMQGAGSLL